VVSTWIDVPAFDWKKVKAEFAPAAPQYFIPSLACRTPAEAAAFAAPGNRWRKQEQRRAKCSQPRRPKIQFVGKNHDKSGGDALTHFGLVDQQGDGIMGSDLHPCIGWRGALRR
jgi:hypothetical protein